MISSKIVRLLLTWSCYLMLVSCTSSTKPLVPNANKLIEVASYETSIRDLSGLTLGDDNQSLWTVSDSTAKIYNISLKGDILKVISVNSVDMEGITYDSLSKSFWVVEERQREVVNISKTGRELGRYAVDVRAFDSNSGLEAICIGSNNELVVLNEKHPMMLIELSKDFVPKAKQELSISKDLSGIAYDDKRGSYWIVSDQSQWLLQWSPIKGLMARYELPYIKAEGVAINTEKDLIYIVSDFTEKLYVYKLQ